MRNICHEISTDRIKALRFRIIKYQYCNQAPLANLMNADSAFMITSGQRTARNRYFAFDYLVLLTRVPDQFTN